MNAIRCLAALIAIAGSVSAGPLNVVQLGPAEEKNLEVKSGGLAQKFTLTFASETGPFLLPQKPAVLRTVGDKIKVLHIKPKKTGQIAVLHPKDDFFAWSLFDSKPSGKKTTLRVINLVKEDTTLMIARKPVEIKAESDTDITEVTRSPVRISFEEGGVPVTHEQEEPSAVVAFLYKSEAEWKIFYINDY